MGNVLGGNLTVNLIAITDEFKRKMSEAGGVVQSVVGKIEQNKEALRKTGLAFTAVGASITAALALSVKQAAAVGDQFDKMSKRTGESAGALSGLAFAAERSGTSIGAVENSIKRAQRNMLDASEGIGEAKDAFDDLGISVSNADGSLLSGTDLLIAFAEATKSMDDASRKAALAQEIFGKSGTDLLPLFADGAEGLTSLLAEADKYGITIDDLAAKQGAEFTDALTNMGSAFKGISLTLGSVLMPTLTPVVNGIADLTSQVTAFMKEHPKLTEGLAVAAGAFGALATAAGALLLGATALPALMAAFSSMGSLLAVSGPVGIALTAAAGLIYALYSNWDVVTAGFKTGYDMVFLPILNGLKSAFTAVWDTVNSVFGWIWDKIELVFGAVWDALTPVIDGFINGFESVWGVVEDVFGWMWDTISTTLGWVYEKFRWVLDKLGIELPELEDVWAGIGDAGERAASAVSGKWAEMKESFALNMAENEKRHADAAAAMESRNSETMDNLDGQWEDHLDQVEEIVPPAMEAAAEPVPEIFAETHDEIEGDFGMTVDDMAADYTGTLTAAAGATPGFFAAAFDGVYENFNKRLGEMGDAWMEAFHEGDFKSGIDFAGEYLVSTFEAAYLDIGGNMLQGLVDKISDALGGVLSDAADAFSGSGSALGGVKNALGSLGGSVASGLASAGSAIASGASAAGTAAMGAIGAIGVGTLGVGAAVAGAAYAIDQLTDGGESKGGHARRLANEYAGVGGGPIAWANWQILEADGNDNSDHHRSGAIKLVDQIMKKAIAGGWTADQTVAEVESQLRLKSLPNKGWSEALVGRYAGAVETALNRALAGDDAVLTFHAGGVIPGLIGQERLIRAYAGEEILRHDDPRNSRNGGFRDIVVNITGNTISSELDMRRLSDIVLDRAMDKLKLRTLITGY